MCYAVQICEKYRAFCWHLSNSIPKSIDSQFISILWSNESNDSIPQFRNLHIKSPAVICGPPKKNFGKRRWVWNEQMKCALRHKFLHKPSIFCMISVLNRGSIDQGRAKDRDSHESDYCIETQRLRSQCYLYIANIYVFICFVDVELFKPYIHNTNTYYTICYIA